MGTASALPAWMQDHRIARERPPGATNLASLSEARYFTSDLKMLPGVHLPLRSMLVTSGSDTLLVSPVGTGDELSAVGAREVTLVAPSLLHSKHIGTARAALTTTSLWGPRGFAEKHPELGPVNTFDVDPWPHAATLPYVVIGGVPLRNEVVFFHRATRTIYTADLVFNIRESAGLLSPLAFRVMGIHQRFAIARMWKLWIKDHAAFKRSIEAVLAWDFDRIAMAHGEILEMNARDRLIGALRERDLL